MSHHSQFRACVVAFTVAALAVAAVSGESAATDLRVEYLEEDFALGIDVAKPRFSWVIPVAESDPRGLSQVAYQINVKDIFTNTVVWDSAVVQSNNTILVPYGGSALESGKKYSWTVIWWSSRGAKAPSSVSTFVTGIVSAAEWLNMGWIGSEAAPQIRVTFDIPAGKTVSGAYAYIGTLASATLFVNGKPAGDQNGVTPWTDIKHIIYQTVDILPFLTSSSNALGLYLGSGFHASVASKIVVILHFSDGTSGRVQFVDQQPAKNASVCVENVPEQQDVTLGCPSGQIIGYVSGYFGTPAGGCHTGFAKGGCDLSTLQSFLNTTCLGQQSCSFVNNWREYGADPCHDVVKHFDGKVVCKPGTPPPPPAMIIPSKWKQAAGPYLFNDPYLGITVNQTLENASFSTVSFDDASWEDGVAVKGLSGSLEALKVQTSTAGETVMANSVTKLSDGSYVADMGRNFVGVIEYSYTTDGSKNISLLHGERLNRDNETNVHGSVFMPWVTDGRKYQLDTYLNPTTGTLRPRFTWHGFQYVQIFSDAPNFVVTADQLKGIVLSPAVKRTGNITFDDDFYNKLFGIIHASQESNFAGYIPTDCPTREKHGWLGDAVTTAEEAMYNFMMPGVYRLFLEAIRDEQKPNGDIEGVVPSKNSPVFADRTSNPHSATDISWSAAYPVIANWIYKYYGDLDIVRDHYPAMKAFVDNLTNLGKDEPFGIADFYTWGDWCPVKARAIATPGTGPELAAFNYILSLDAMAEMAENLGISSDAAEYKNLATRMRAVFHKAYYNPAMHVYGNNTLLIQSLTLAPLALENTIPDDLLPSVKQGLLENIAGQKNHLTVGSVGAKHLLPQLTRNGFHNVSLTIASQKTFPSWGYWVEQGATTCWEDWSGFADATHPPPPTRNHIFLCGGLGEWMYRSLAGIEPQGPGYQTMSIAPQVSYPQGPHQVTSTVWTVRGTVSVSWKAADVFTLDITVPHSSTATVTVPFGQHVVDPSAAVVTESGTTVWSPAGFHSVDGITAGRLVPGGVEFSVLSGFYSFVSH